MVSKFKDVVESIARSKQISFVSSEEGTIREINRGLDDGTMELKDAMRKLRGRLGIKFAEDDYRKVEKEMGYSGVK